MPLLRFGTSDTEASALISAELALRVIFSILGAAFVDVYGVRPLALLSLVLSIFARLLLVFGRSRSSLLFSLLVLSPPGEALLRMGLYSVALKRVTLRRSRVLVFSVAYASANAALVCTYAAADYTRSTDRLILGRRFSGLRIFMLLTLCVLALELAVAASFLRDVQLAEQPSHRQAASRAEDTIPHGPNAQLEIGSPASSEWTDSESERGWRLEEWRPNQMEGGGDFAAGLTVVWQTLALGSFWRALAFDVFSTGAHVQLTALDTLLPPVLERLYGEEVPFYSIRALNPWVNSVAPWLVAPLVTSFEPVSGMLPGDSTPESSK